MSSEEKIGLGRAAKLVADRATNVGRLTVQLALDEIKQKLAALGIGLGLTGAALVVGFFALCLLVGAAVAALTLVLATWLALLVVGGGLFLLAALLGAIGATLLRKGTRPVPDQALREAKLTAEALRDGR